MSVQPLDLVAAGLAATGVILFWLGLVKFGNRQTLGVRLRLHVQADGLAASWRERDEADEQRTGRLEAARLTQRLKRSSLGLFVQSQLVRAGVTLLPEHFVRLQAALAGVAALLGYLVLGSTVPPVRLLVALLLGAAGVAVPLQVLRFLERRRLAAFERQLPQAIDAMAGTLQAGSALPPAMEVIAREMPPPISVEFRRVLREMDLGLSLPDSLANLQDRVRSADVVLLTSAIDIQQRVGGDLAGIFKGISHTIRERLRIRSEINVLTAQGRYSAYIITALPFAMFAFLWFANRAYVSKLLEPGIGGTMLAVAIGGIVLGYYFMKKIVTIEV